MSPLVAELSQSAIHALVPVLMAYGIAALGRCMHWLKLKADNDRLEADQGRVKSAMAVLSDICEWVVAEVEQTVVKRVRDNVGTLPPDLAEQAKQRAEARVREIYGEHGVAKLADDLAVTEAAVRDIISVRIEAAVLKMKYPAAPPRTRFDPAVFGGMTAQEKASSAANPAQQPVPVPFPPVP